MKTVCFKLRSWLPMLALSVFFALPGSFGFAQDNAAPAKTDGPKSDGKKSAGARKSTTINFEDQLVEGQAQKPELFYLLQKKNANFKRLIRLRDDFLPEMRKTSEDIQRKGSGN